MSQKYNRAERLYGLAEYCKRKQITPDSTIYVSTIIGVCAANFGLSKESAEEHAATLRSAWLADRWQAITHPDDEAETGRSGSEEVSAGTPTLSELKNLLSKKSEPVKRIAPKNVLEGETAPRSVVQRLIGMAKDNDFNGVGKLVLAEVRFELGDKSLQIKDLIELLSQYAPEVCVDQRPGNVLYLHFPKTKRRVVPAIPQLRDPE